MDGKLTDRARRAYLRDLTSELKNPHLGWILDDAVMGAGVYYDILGDYGLDPANADHRAILDDAISANLREGF